MGSGLPTPDGLTPIETLEAVRVVAQGQYERAGKVFITDIAPRLAGGRNRVLRLRRPR